MILNQYRCILKLWNKYIILLLWRKRVKSTTWQLKKRGDDKHLWKIMSSSSEKDLTNTVYKKQIQFFYMQIFSQIHVPKCKFILKKQQFIMLVELSIFVVDTKVISDYRLQIIISQLTAILHLQYYKGKTPLSLNMQSQ